MARPSGPARGAGQSGRPTIRDVARAAEVSPATAARALSGSGYVADAARRRVHDAAEA
ncbi:LacI family DNA-binding transcriptional regulator, partial [Georgenia sp. 10Sc9-8]|nr:LacI family DNA-binding transcriptional regulator [Georgenia halotolerans]